MNPKLNTRQILQIALEACLSDVTVRKVYKGSGHRNSRELVIKAAKKLGFPLPEGKENSEEWKIQSVELPEGANDE